VRRYGKAVNVLVIVTGGPSEVLQATPLLRTLGEGMPDSRITLAGPPATAGLAAGLPAAAEALALPALASGASIGSLAGAWLGLRRRRFDVAVLCSTRPRARLLAYGAGISRRLGPGGGLTEWLLSDHTPRRSENDAATWLRLAGLLGVRDQVHAPEFVPEPGARVAGESRLLGSGFEDGRILVAIAPGVGLPGSAPETTSEAWEHERYAHLANQLATRHGAAIVVLGTTDDRPRVEAMLVDLDASFLDLCGELGVDETAAVLGRCDLLVAGDSPLLHLAAAVGTPAIGLFGATDGRRRGPYGPGHRVIQALPDSPPDMGMGSLLSWIRVEDVLAGIEATL